MYTSSFGDAASHAGFGFGTHHTDVRSASGLCKGISRWTGAGEAEEDVECSLQVFNADKKWRGHKLCGRRSEPEECSFRRDMRCRRCAAGIGAAAGISARDRGTCAIPGSFPV